MNCIFAQLSLSRFTLIISKTMWKISSYWEKRNKKPTVIIKVTEFGFPCYMPYRFQHFFIAIIPYYRKKKQLRKFLRWSWLRKQFHSMFIWVLTRIIIRIISRTCFRSVSRKRSPTIIFIMFCTTTILLKIPIWKTD